MYEMGTGTNILLLDSDVEHLYARAYVCVCVTDGRCHLLFFESRIGYALDLVGRSLVA